MSPGPAFPATPDLQETILTHVSVLLAGQGVPPGSGGIPGVPGSGIPGDVPGAQVPGANLSMEQQQLALALAKQAGATWRSLRVSCGCSCGCELRVSWV